jgi:hypothetical protein
MLPSTCLSFFRRGSSVVVAATMLFRSTIPIKRFHLSYQVELFQCIQVPSVIYIWSIDNIWRVLTGQEASMSLSRVMYTAVGLRE